MNSEKKLSEEQFSQIMDGLVEECEDVLRRFLPDPDHMPSGEEPAATVASAMRYSTMAGGKRLRPLLIARISDLYGGDRQLAEPFMAALEMIHTYSLVSILPMRLPQRHLTRPALLNRHRLWCGRSAS